MINDCLLQVCTQDSVKNAFKVTGIWPYDPNISTKLKKKGKFELSAAFESISSSSSSNNTNEKKESNNSDDEDSDNKVGEEKEEQAYNGCCKYDEDKAVVQCETCQVYLCDDHRRTHKKETLTQLHTLTNINPLKRKLFIIPKLENKNKNKRQKRDIRLNMNRHGDIANSIKN